MGPFHPGERELQRRFGVLEEARAVGRGIASHLLPAAARFLSRQRLAVASTVGPGGGVWASLLTGPRGFLTAVDSELLRILAPVLPGDPLAANLAGNTALGLLAIDLRTRQRMRFNGRGLVAPEGLFLLVEQAYGNCPKYIQLREERADVAATPCEPQVSDRLDARQRAWIAGADTFFLATAHPHAGADASHRGGFPGFVGVLGPRSVAFPDYPGNAMFNSLGNLLANPRAGLLFVDFVEGHVLQLSGRARLEPDRTVRVDVEEVRETRRAHSLRFRLEEYSPANPPIPRHGAPGSGISTVESQEESR